MKPAPFGRLARSAQIARFWLALYVVGLGIFIWSMVAPDQVATAHLGAYSDSGSFWPIALQLALGAAALLTYYVPRARVASLLALLTGLLAITTIVVGFFAYATCPTAKQQSTLWAPLTFALNLIAGNVQPCGTGSESTLAPALQLARLSGSLVLLLAAVGILASVFRNQSDRLEVLLARSLVVVVGLTDGAMPLLAQLTARRASRTAVVVIVPDLSLSSLAAVRRLGADVIVVHPDDAEGLRRLLSSRRHIGQSYGRFKVRDFYAVSPDPSENLKWAARVGAAADASLAERHARAPRMIVRIDDPWHAEVWRRSNPYRIGARDGESLATDLRSPAADLATLPPSTPSSAAWTSDALSVYEMTASMILDRVLVQQDPAVDRIVLIGASPLGLAICSALAQREREATVTGDPLPVSSSALVLLGPGAALLRAHHRLRQVSFGNADWSSTVTVEPSEVTLESLRRVVAGSRRPVIVFADHPAEFREQSAQYLALLNPQWMILSWEAETGDLADRPTVGQLYPFGLTSVLPDMLPIDSWERAAQVVHEQYRMSLRAHGLPDKPTTRPWGELDPFYRESNIRLITNTLGTLARMGRSFTPASDERAARPVPEPLSPAELLVLAQEEHYSWADHLRSNGWRYAPVRDDARRRHPALVAWTELSPRHRERTVGAVHAAVLLLRDLGYAPQVGPE